MFNRRSHTTWRAVDVNIRHGAVAFVEHVFKVQTDAGGFADFVMRGQVQRGVWALGQRGRGSRIDVCRVFVQCVAAALPVDVGTQVQTVGHVIRGKEFKQMNRVRRMQLNPFAVFDFGTCIRRIQQLFVAQATADREFHAFCRGVVGCTVVFLAIREFTCNNAQMVAFVHKDGCGSIQTAFKP